MTPAIPNPQSSLVRPILLAGLLGGILGGGLSFAASRWIVPAGPVSAQSRTSPAATVPVPEEARDAVKYYVGKLNAMKYDEFIADVIQADPFGPTSPQAEFNKKAFNESRTRYHGTFKNHMGEAELLREIAVSPDLVQFYYLEKFEQSGVVWSFVFYHTKDGWRLNRVHWSHELDRAFPPS